MNRNEWAEALYGHGTELILPDAYKSLLRKWAKYQMAMGEWEDYRCDTPDGHFSVNFDTSDEGVRYITVFPNTLVDGELVTDVNWWTTMFLRENLND